MYIFGERRLLVLTSGKPVWREQTVASPWPGPITGRIPPATTVFKSTQYAAVDAIPCTGGHLRAWQKISWRWNYQQHHHHKVVNYLHYYIVQPWINYTY